MPAQRAEYNGTEQPLHVPLEYFIQLKADKQHVLHCTATRKKRCPFGQRFLEEMMSVSHLVASPAKRQAARFRKQKGDI